MLLTYFGSAVTRNYSEKIVTSIPELYLHLNYPLKKRIMIFFKCQMNLLYKTATEVFKHAKNSGLWLKTSMKVRKSH